MLTVGKAIPGGHGLAAALIRRAATVVLDWDTRQKSRFDAVDSTGRALGVFLPRGRVLRGGDVLVGEDGSLIVVIAQPRALLAVTVSSGGAPIDLLRAAYHLGNRHVPLDVRAGGLQLEPDHVLAEMLVGMGLRVEAVEAPFEPEAGAYGSERAGHGHVHDGQCNHGHGHEHKHEHGHEHQ